MSTRTTGWSKASGNYSRYSKQQMEDAEDGIGISEYDLYSYEEAYSYNDENDDN